ncbi:MAG TPA: hypothetical protein VNS22_09140 [Geminicoccus sp.]|uniref:hypothetical protein n=1 Tax=Geminicoccus sp. TaxID=2024832 RepID=UPI002C53AEBC|nr:hypothetical protein [Geminicoccus sp.]HWL68534.1 hypothetical protein [Geminicoccus sp.]
MIAAAFLRNVMRPTAAWCQREAGIPFSLDSDRFLLAVALQESQCTHRAQITRSGAPGPARSYWQGEKTGGMVAGVLNFHAENIQKMSRALYAAAGVIPDPYAIWRAIEWHDALAHGLARLLLLTDPYRIPTEQSAAWDCYAARLWRPGRPRPEEWPENWQAASIAVAAETA